MPRSNNGDKSYFIFVNLALIFILGLVPLLWFKGGCLIKSVDLGIPLNLSEWQSYLFSWLNQRATGTYPIDNFAALFFLLLPAILQEAGISIIASQKVQFVFWFMISGFAFYYLLVSLFKGKHPHPVLMLAGVGFYMFNLYLEPVWLGFNIANLSAYVALPLLAGFFINGLRTKKLFKYVFYSGIIGVILSGIGVNPPIMYVCITFFISWIVFNYILHVTTKKNISRKKFIKVGVLFALVLILVNLFWAYPQTMRLLKATGSKPITKYREAVEEGIKERSKYTSLLNVMRFQAAWTWHEDYEDDPYVLYSEFYKTNKFFIALSMLPALCAFLAVFSLRRYPYCIFFILLSIIGIVFSVGIHQPFSFLNTLLIKLIPGFWMIRSPWYKWSLFTALGFSVCISCFIDLIRQKIKTHPFIFHICGIAIFLSILLYGYPILTGCIFTSPEERHYIPPNHIKIPEYVTEASRWFNEQEGFFRIMVLPSIARRITDWGYAGYEPVLAYFTDKPIIAPVMRGTYGSPYIIPKFDNLLYEWLYINKDDHDEKKKWDNIERQNSDKVASTIMPLFNIKYLLFEGDIRWDFYDRYESPEFVRSKLALQKDVELIKEFGKWRIYKVNNSLNQIYASRKINILDGSPRMLEPLSRTGLLSYNNIFAHDVNENFIDYVKNNNLIEKIISYNTADFINNDTYQRHLLLSTRNSEIFYAKEVVNEAVKKIIRTYFKKGTYDRQIISDNNLVYFKANKEPIKAYIDSMAEDDMILNLRVVSLCYNADAFIDIYLNSSLIKKIYARKNEESTIRLESVVIRPGSNILSFSTAGGNSDSVIALYPEIIIYSREFNADINFREAGDYYVSLYPAPINDSAYFKDAKSVKVGSNSIKLELERQNIEYSPKKSIAFREGVNTISFLQNQDEDYYALISPKFRSGTTEIISIPAQYVNPVEYKVKLSDHLSGKLFLFFTDSYNSSWQASQSDTMGREIIETHFIANGYANGWLLNDLQKGGQARTVMLEYTVQRQFWAGLAVSIPAVIICLLGSIICTFTKTLKNNEDYVA